MAETCNPDLSTAPPSGPASKKTRGLWWALVFALAVLDAVALHRVIQVRLRLGSLRARAEAEMSGPQLVGSCDGVDVSGRPVVDACRSGAAVVVLHGKDLDRELAVWAPVVERRPDAPIGVVGICADASCIEAARRSGRLAFPVLSGTAYGLALAAGLAAQRDSFIVVASQGLVRGRLPLPQSSADAAALMPRIAEVANASPRRP